MKIILRFIGIAFNLIIQAQVVIMPSFQAVQKANRIATLTTIEVSSITTTAATSGGNVTSDGGAVVTSRGVCWSTTTNPTIANNHTSDGNGSGIFVSNLTSLNPITLYYVKAYATNSAGTAYGNEVSFTSAWACGYPLTINHLSGVVAPVSKNVNYGTVTSSLSGASKCWITQNLGASQQATSITDATEASAGWYWQFNRKQGYKHDGTTRTPNTVWIYPISESLNWVDANDPCTIELGSGWRVPTALEWNNAIINGSWNTYTDAFASILKLHMAGDLVYNNGNVLEARGVYGTYWGSTYYNNTLSKSLDFYDVQIWVKIDYKAYGCSIRCIKD